MDREALGLWQAAVLALLLHAAAAWLLGGPGGVLASWIGLSQEEARRLAEEGERAAAEPLRFEFIDIPDEPEEPNPEARVGSDRSRRARAQVRPADAPAPDNPDPYARGSTPQKVAYQAAEEPVNAAPAPEAPQAPSGGGEARGAGGEAGPADAGSERAADGAPGGDRSPGAGRGPRLTGTRISPGEIDEVFDNPAGAAGAQIGRLSFDSAAIDWGPYAREMARAIRRAWLERIPPAFYAGLRGVVQVSFRIQRGGEVTGILLLDSYGVRLLGDGRAEVGPGVRPFEVTVEETLQAAEIPPLPDRFPESSVGVTAAFCYGVPCR